MKNIEHLQQIATQIRRDIIRMVHAAKSGHPGGSLGCTDLLTVLFFEVLDINPEKYSYNGANEDMFFLSNGHLSPLLYSVMARRGYFSVNKLKTFRKIDSQLQGHPTPAKDLKGIRITTGSLGQGLSVAIGAAIAKKNNNDEKIIYTLTGDGELQEGQNWEAIMFAGAKKIDNLITIVDYNKKQIDGTTDDVLSLGNLKAKFEAFQWKVLEMNGNDIPDVLNGLKEAKNSTKNGVPVVILMKTEMGMGVDFMMGTHKWHGTPPNDEQTQKALEQLPITLGDF